MVDMLALTAQHATPAAAARRRGRHRAERRLKLYGMAAIALAGLALATLLVSVLGKAGGAFTEHYLVLPVTLEAAKIDPEVTRDPAVIRAADFDGMVKDVMRGVFPSVTERRAKLALYNLVSSGAAYELRTRVMEDPALVGTTMDFPFLASDVVDLYLKGAYGELEAQAHRGDLRVMPQGENVTIETNTDDFAPALAALKVALLDEAAFERRQAVLQDNGVVAFNARAEATDDPASAEASRAEATSRAAERDRRIAAAEALEARAARAGGMEALDRNTLSVLVRLDGGWIKLRELGGSSATGEVLSPLGGATTVSAEEWSFFILPTPERGRNLSDAQIVWVETLRDAGAVKQRFNTRFFTTGDSREPELAGIKGAAVGSFWTMLVTFFIAFPIGVLAAIYLEEFAPRNRFTQFIEVNINNLAAVPSIVFGLLGLAVFIGFFGVPRSAPLAGGMVLAVMTLPTIIIAARTSIAAVPPSIRDAALGLGASQLQTSFHHVFPLALPGILTGTIIGMARALGETAPLIMIGMVAFITEVPKGILSFSTVLPVQIYHWSDFPEAAFEARTAAAILTLLVFLIAMNALAVFLRTKFERRW